MMNPPPAEFSNWLSTLESRHLADLRLAEVTRALRALSSAYVERRHAVARGATLDSRGKRAAFALFYAPLHFLTTWHVAQTLEVSTPPPMSVLDVGCGTGAAGVAWSLATGRVPISGIDRHPWAVSEARWTYRAFTLAGQARVTDAARLPPVRPGTGIVAAYVLNELQDETRRRLETQLIDATSRDVSLLILEPIAKPLTPWWDDTRRRIEDVGGRADEWRIPVALPPLLHTLDKAAGLKHQVLTARSLFVPRR